MTVQIAHLHATLCLALAILHIALAFGAPWSSWGPGLDVTQAAQGDAWDGPGAPLSPAGRLAAALTVPVLLYLALAIISAAGFPGLGWPRWTGWLAVAVQGALAALSLAARRPVERRLWGPCHAVLTAMALAVMTA
ncbi:hypothetical protein SAMN04488105_104224 [Salipiger thiooxidans]|uniref:Uncharacterized protein n=1 Tax=Salipiger thiooxidans TaxID=282683 RepID=A0A1G7DH15_9RHOB|nr:hypothetical protein [Salipiger thiooxidans]SDE50864.1 hypothetical protein SAMN04488105_104224 [Salipiger thiooxidans]